MEFALSSTVTGRPAFLYFLYFPIFLSVPIIFLYFDEIPIFSYIILTPKKCRDARMSRQSSYAKMHTWFNRIDVTEQATLLTKSDHGMLF